MHPRLRNAVLASLLLCTAACTHTFGPVVMDIQSDGGGWLIIRTCTLEIANRGEHVEAVDCSKKALNVNRPAPTVALPRGEMVATPSS
jgi:hypothetical protein